MKKSYSYLIILFCLLNCNLTNAQNIFVNNQDQTSSSYSIEEVQRLTFENDQLILRLFSGTEFSFSLSNLANYRYGDQTLNTESFLAEANAWDLNIYPNPSKDVVNISFNLLEATSVTYQVFDLKGRKMIERKLPMLAKGKNNIEFSLKLLSSGTYLIQLATERVKISRKLIKN